VAPVTSTIEPLTNSPKRTMIMYGQVSADHGRVSASMTRSTGSLKFCTAIEWPAPIRCVGAEQAFIDDEEAAAADA
jgi:hypothetical protein